MRIAIYPGSFDPVHAGHEWMIEQGCRMFDRLVVGIGTNPDKLQSVIPSTRIQDLYQIAKQFSNIIIDGFSDELLVSFAEKHGASFILRGVRNPHDFEYEQQSADINRLLSPKLTTVFLVPPPHLRVVSSSLIRTLKEVAPLNHNYLKPLLPGANK